MAANSKSWVGYFSSCFLNYLEAYATTWPSCIKTHPKPCPDASQYMENDFSMSGIVKTGVVVSLFFNS
jgi:hypothetical protein